MPVAEGLPLQANPGTRWSQAAPLLYDLCFLKGKSPSAPAQHLPGLRQPNVTAPSVPSDEGSYGERGGTPHPCGCAASCDAPKGQLGGTIRDHIPRMASLQRSRGGKPLRRSPALPFLLTWGATAAPGADTNQPHRSPASQQCRKAGGGTHTMTKGLGPPKAFVVVLNQLFE